MSIHKPNCAYSLLNLVEAFINTKPNSIQIIRNVNTHARTQDTDAQTDAYIWKRVIYAEKFNFTINNFNIQLNIPKIKEALSQNLPGKKQSKFCSLALKRKINNFQLCKFVNQAN